MQLKGDLRHALTAACSLLLAASPAQAEPPAEPAPEKASDWSFDSAILFYKEPDRVQAIEPVVMARWALREEEYLNFKLTIDSLTGASASGATPSSLVQTYTTPSGGGTYAIAPGETPLDPTFLDTRVALNVSWDSPYGRFTRMTYALNVSSEYDYQSIAASATWARDFNLKNTTLAVGVSFGTDTLDPVGGTPVPLTLQPTVPWYCPGGGPCGVAPARLAPDQDKTLSDLLIGVTQILSPKSLLQLNLSWGTASGYLTDPYKLVSVVDGAPGPNQGDPTGQLYEGRPDSRTKTSLYGLYRRQTDGGDTWDASFRHMWDDWGITSETVDFHYRWQFGDASYLQPHLRYYTQSAADFYTRFLIDGAALPAEASADYRLGDMTTSTIGLKYGRVLRNGHEFGVHLEYYRQSGDSHPSNAIGVLQGYDLFPVVTATMVQFDYSF